VDAQIIQLCTSSPSNTTPIKGAHSGGSVRAGQDRDWSPEATRRGSSSKANQRERELPLPTAVD
jgi:hypothetical protein